MRLPVLPYAIICSEVKVKTMTGLTKKCNCKELEERINILEHELETLQKDLAYLQGVVDNLRSGSPMPRYGDY